MKKILKNFTAMFCAAFMISSVSAACAYADENTEVVLPSGKSISFLESELRDYSNMEFSGDEPSFASAAVGVFQGGEILYTGYFGETDIKNHIPADENSVYEWGSISKTFTWVSVMQLWEQGKIDFEKDIREYLPKGFFNHLSYDEPITMLNLMNHTGGWQESTVPIFTSDENNVLSLKDSLQNAEPVQVFKPGEIQAYSNYGAALAGYIVECISGMDYCEYVHKNILDVLEMNHTAVNPTHSDNEFVYEQRKKTRAYSNILFELNDMGQCFNYVEIYPAGAVTGTLGDLMIYAQALVDDNAPLFKNPETQQIMLSGTSFYGESDIPVNAHGFWFTEYGVRTFGHSGATTAGQANMIIDPESQTGLAVLVNQPSGNWFLNNAPEFVFGKLSSEKYSNENPQPVNTDKIFISSRSVHKGMLKYVSLLSAVNDKMLGKIENTGNGVYQVTAGDSAALLGNIELSDGKTGLRSVSVDYIPVQSYILKLCLLTVYILIAVVSVFSLLINHKLKKYGKLKYISGNAMTISGYFAEIISVVLFFSTFVIYTKNSGGIPDTAGIFIGIFQIICTAVCAAAALSAPVSAFLKKSEKPKINLLRTIFDTAGNILTIMIVLYFEMYMFC